MCNNKEEFEEEMKRFGIYVPEQDAAWEREGNIFDGIYERHGTCDAETCLCPHGREYDVDYTEYEIVSTQAGLHPHFLVIFYFLTRFYASTVVPKEFMLNVEIFHWRIKSIGNASFAKRSLKNYHQELSILSRK